MSNQWFCDLCLCTGSCYGIKVFDKKRIILKLTGFLKFTENNNNNFETNGGLPGIYRKKKKIILKLSEYFEKLMEKKETRKIFKVTEDFLKFTEKRKTDNFEINGRFPEIYGKKKSG